MARRLRRVDARARRGPPRRARRGSPARASVSGAALLRRRSASTTSTPGIWMSSARCANAGRNARGLGRDVRVRVEQRVAERRLVARRQLALDLAAGGRGREPVELVEQARDRVGAVGIELDRVVRARAQEQEAELLRRDDLGDRVRGRAAALRGRHLLAADVEELVRDVERRLALEHLAGDRVATGRASRRPSRGPCRTARSSRRTATTGPPTRGSRAASRAPPNGETQPRVAAAPSPTSTRSGRHS